MTVGRVECPKCGRPCAARSPRCLGCGASLNSTPGQPPAQTKPSAGSGTSLLQLIVGLLIVAAGSAYAWRAGWLLPNEAATIAHPTIAPVRAPMNANPSVASSQPASGMPAADNSSRAQPAPPRALPALPSHPGWESNASGLDSALSEQKSSHCPVLVYFWASWCPHCKKFDSSILPDPGIDQALSTAIKVRIEPDAGDAEKALAKQYGVTGYPTLLLLTHDGAAPVRLSSGLRPPDDSPDPTVLSGEFKERVAFDWATDAHNDVAAGRLDDAIDVSDRLIAFDPTYQNGYGYEVRADAFKQKGDVPSALRDYQAACAAGCPQCCTSGGP